MAESVRVSIRDLREYFSILVGHLEIVCGSDALLNLQHDGYWSLGRDERRAIYEEPVGHSIGLLSECLDNLRGMSAADDVLSYGFVWLAEVLRTVGEEVVD